MSIPILHQDPNSPFPAPHTAGDREGGLIATGGCLSSERLTQAYRQGIFPWFSPGQPILWWNPIWRAVLLPEHLHVSKSFKKFLRKRPYQITLNRAFSEVIQHCANVPRGPDNGTWITPEMIQAYLQLHQKGIAHSVEVWQDDHLIGGLYGVLTGTVFSGESMFSLKPNASKLALLCLTQAWSHAGLRLIDCQIMNDHLASLGAIHVSRSDYLNLLTQIQHRNETIAKPFTAPQELIYPNIGNP